MLCSLMPRKFVVFIVPLVLSACAATSIFQSYTSEAVKYKSALSADNAEPVLERLDSKATGADKLLYLSERGRIHQVHDQFEASKADFEQVIQIYSKGEDKARINVTGVAADSAALFSNDNAIPYQGYDFERVFLHQFQAFNYLAANDVSGAGVELRRAALEQRNLELANERAIAAAEEEAQEQSVQLPNLAAIPQLQGMSELVGDTKSAFQNAYTFYASAVIWESMGERNSALVDYKKALEINPNNKGLQQDVQRLDQRSRRSKAAALVVLYEDGFIPERQSFTFTIPDFYNDKTYSIAFPYYSAQNWYQPVPLLVAVDNGLSHQTELLANFGNMAVASLKEKVPALMVRQILRARVKYEMQAQAQKADQLVGIATTLYNIASERADLRNWLTLPNNAQAVRVEIPAGGEHNVQLSTLTGQAKVVPVALVDGRTTILRVFNFNNNLKTQTFQL